MTDSTEPTTSTAPDWAHAYSPPDLKATIKEEFADFRVDEDLGFALSGSGEHLCVRVQKTDMGTTDVARRFSEVLGVPLKAIGYAGMKDRRGECSQWFSLKLPAGREGELASVEDAALRVLETSRNGRKIRIGSHRRNRFQLRLRHCQGSAEAFEARLQQIRGGGIPNYFGQQRFGRDMNNLPQVQAMFAAGSAVRQGRKRRSLLLSAARAYLFNEVLSSRIRAENWARFCPGDVLNLNGTSRCFALQPGQDWDEVLQARLDSFDIHLTGPLAGTIDPANRYTSRDEAADMEEVVLAKFPDLVAGLKDFGLDADRRPLRFVAEDLESHWEESDLILTFSLPRGTYATSLLREVCVTSQPGE